MKAGGLKSVGTWELIRVDFFESQVFFWMDNDILLYNSNALFSTNDQ
jgi:hypothetical protein